MNKLLKEKKVISVYLSISAEYVKKLARASRVIKKIINALKISGHANFFIVNIKRKSARVCAGIYIYRGFEMKVFFFFSNVIIVIH